ncbi:MAG TPA: diguanylate cyclase [Ktedonobacteraceae bacterium]|nr:diguanylate cyclase [Ktedonobacteraceae bacterium]
MNLQKQTRARRFASMPRFFWYSVAFSALYLMAFGSWLLLQKGTSFSSQAQGSIGIALAAILSIVLSWIGARRQARARETGTPPIWRLQSRTPLLFSAALIFQVVGNLLIADNTWHHQFSFPWWTGVVMGGIYPALLLGVLALPRHTLSGRRPLLFVLDSMILLIAVITFSWYFTFGPTLLRAAGGSLPSVVSSTAFPFFDLLLLSSLILLTNAMEDRGLRLAIPSLSVALALFAITDSFTTYLTLHGVYVIPAWLDIGWATGSLAIGLSIQSLRWLAGRLPTEEAALHEPSSGIKTPLWRSLLLYALVPAVLALVLYVWGKDPKAPLAMGTYCFALFLLVLIFVKQLVSLHEIHLLNRGLARAQQALHEKNGALEQANARLEQLSTTDMLTNLPNHRALQMLLAQEGERARRFDRPLSVLFFDGDRFKRVNDSYGHAIGDIVLRELGERTRSVLRAGDTVGRFGGEEFLVLLPETGEQEARDVAERLRSAVTASPLATSGVAGGIAVTVSIGVASYPADGDTMSDVQEQADQAMYWAKRLGRNQVRTATEAGHANRDAELKAVTAQALERLDQASLDGRDPESQGRVEQLFLIYSLMTALDWREPGMSEHAHEVSDLVAAMARSLHFDKKRTWQATTAAFLHDIGKIAIPDRLLQQPRRLFTPQEWRLLQQHAELGADIVEASPWLRDLAPAIRHHHERWDGAGVPDGLAGEAIPLEARLIAVAEAYHAMISERPYQAARPVYEALAELERGAGTQFDPALVPLFREVLKSLEHERSLPLDEGADRRFTQV